MCVNEESKILMSLPNFYKSKKMRVGRLWNDLPWLYNIFQAGKVQVCFGKLKNSGLSILHNDSRIQKRSDGRNLQYMGYKIRKQGHFWPWLMCRSQLRLEASRRKTQNCYLSNSSLPILCDNSSILTALDIPRVSYVQRQQPFLLSPSFLS